MKNKRRNITSQAKTPTNKQFSPLLREYFDSHAPSHQLMWGHILWMGLRIKNIYASQRYLGDRGDIGRSQANLNLNEMKRALILNMRNRGIKRTCLTSIPREIMQPTFLLQLTDLFPWLYNHVRYALLINCSESGYRNDRTRVLDKRRETVYKPVLYGSPVAQGFKNDTKKREREGPHSLRGVGTRESDKPSLLNPLKWTDDDYEEFARSINAESHSGAIGSP